VILKNHANLDAAMSPRPITHIPNSSTLDWDAHAGSDGAELRTTLISQRHLQVALTNEVRSKTTGVLGGLQTLARSSFPSSRPRAQISDQAFERMKRLESLQQRVSELVPYKPNNVPSIVASDGEAFYRNEMRVTSGSRAPQHSAQAARETVRWGTGVCSEINNVLFRALAADETVHAEATMRNRAAGQDYGISERYPVMFAQNSDPHGFVLFGNPRDQTQAPNVLVGDSWEGLPVVKTWSNTEYKTRSYSVKLQTTAGASGIENLPLSDLANIAMQRLPSAEVEAHLAAHERPPIGPALLANVYDICNRYGINLFDEATSADRLDITYQNTSTNEIFTPSIAFRDYQNYRMALSKPQQYQMLRTYVKNSDGGSA
jgi:hypothetical protein